MDPRPLLISSSKPRVEIINPPECFEVWTMNSGFLSLSRVDALFEMHDYRWRLGIQGDHENYYGFLRSMKVPIYMQEHYWEIPSSISYPKYEVDRKMRELTELWERELFSCTVSYMMALAIYRGYKWISLEGFETMDPTVRANISFWVGLAIGQGIKVRFPDKMPPFKSEFIYGYEEKRFLEKTGRWPTGEPVIQRGPGEGPLS